MTEAASTSASPSGNQSQASNDAGSNAASQSNQQQTTTQQTAATSPVRPAELADKAFDAYFDPQKGVRFDALAKDFNDLRASKAQHDLAMATVPKDVAGYNATIPDNIDWPKTAKGEVVKFEIPDDDPALAEFKKFAFENKWPQEQMTKTLSLYARMRAGEEAMVANARAAEQGKLGANGPARVDAVSTFLTAKLGTDKGKALMDRLVLSTDIEAMEDLVKAFSSQGGGSFDQRHRENDRQGRLTEEEYLKLPLSERRQYQLNGRVN